MFLVKVAAFRSIAIQFYLWPTARLCIVHSTKHPVSLQMLSRALGELLLILKIMTDGLSIVTNICKKP